MKYSKYLILLLIFTLTLNGCKDDPSNQQPLNQKVTTSILGTILDESNSPVSNVIIDLEGNSATTDEYGNFSINNVEISANNAFLKANKTGYFLGSRTFQPVANTTNKITITLLSKTLSGTIDAASGGDITLTDGTNLTLNAGSVANPDGSIYNGMINVFVKRLNPVEDNFETIMPGNLIAEDASGDTKVLESYGMLAVELQGRNNEVLNIADNQTAEITLPLDASLVANAPTTIPLWFFDETEGIWMEEGVATLVGNQYVGEVNHFSFWNCDVPFDLVKLTGRILSGTTPLNGVTIKITRAGGNGQTSGYGITDIDGVFCGLVPANEALEVQIIDNCNDIAISFNLGAITEDIDIGDFQATAISNLVNISGNANDCDDNAISNGYVILKTDDYQFVQSTTDGSFNFTFLACANTSSVEIKVFDITNGTESGWQEFLVSSSSINVGNVLACDDITTYFKYDITGYGTPESYFCGIVSGPYDEDPEFITTIMAECGFPSPSIELANDTPLTTGVEYTILNDVSQDDYFLFWWEVDGNFEIYHSHGSYTVVFSSIGPESGDLIEGTITGYSDVIDDDDDSIVGAIQVSGSFRLFGL